MSEEILQKDMLWRKTKIIVKINKFTFNTNPKTKILASYDITFTIAKLPILVKNMKVIQGNEKIFVSFPSHKFRGRNGNWIETQYMLPMNKEVIKFITDFIAEHFTDAHNKLKDIAIDAMIAKGIQYGKN